MKQKDNYLANLKPTRGNGQSGVRSVVIISENNMNNNLRIKIVCPLTSKCKNLRLSVLYQK